MAKFDGSIATIKLSGVEMKPTKTGGTLYIIKDENDDKYSFFTTRRVYNEVSKEPTGESVETAAFREYKNCQIGDVLEVGYIEQEYDYETPQGEKKKGKRRSVRFINKLDNTEIQKPVGPPSHPVTPEITIDDSDIPWA